MSCRGFCLVRGKLDNMVRPAKKLLPTDVEKNYGLCMSCDALFKDAVFCGCCHARLRYRMRRKHAVLPRI